MGWSVWVKFLKDAVQEFANKSAASAASLDYVKFQAAIKSAASAADLMEMCIFGAFRRQKCAFPNIEDLFCNFWPR